MGNQFGNVTLQPGVAKPSLYKPVKAQWKVTHGYVATPDLITEQQAPKMASPQPQRERERAWISSESVPGRRRGVGHNRVCEPQSVY